MTKNIRKIIKKHYKKQKKQFDTKLFKIKKIYFKIRTFKVCNVCSQALFQMTKHC